MLLNAVDWGVFNFSESSSILNKLSGAALIFFFRPRLELTNSKPSASTLGLPCPTLWSLTWHNLPSKSSLDVSMRSLMSFPDTHALFLGALSTFRFRLRILSQNPAVTTLWFGQVLLMTCERFYNRRRWNKLYIAFLWRFGSRRKDRRGWSRILPSQVWL